MSEPGKYADGEAPDIMTGEIKLALTALRQRLHRSGKYEEWRAKADELFEESIAGQDLGHKAIQRAKRMAQVAAARALKTCQANLASVDPAELPLWGFKAPSHASHAEKRRVSKLLVDDTEVLEAALHREPLLQGVKELAQEEARLQWLVLQVPPNCEADTKLIVKWVIDYMKVSLDCVEPDDVPSRSALILLAECRADDMFRRDFLKKWMDKFLPTKAQVEYEQMFADDGQKSLSLVEDTLAVVTREGAKDERLGTRESSDGTGDRAAVAALP